MNEPTRPRPPGSSLLAAIAFLVPASHREGWLAEWNAELAHAWGCRSGSDRRLATRLRLRCLGAIVDALWIRRHSTNTSRRTSMFAHDVRYAARSLARKPAFTAVVVGTLALCIGANTAIFSVVNSVLLHGLPYRDLDRLVAIWSNDTQSKRDRNSVSIGDFRDMQMRAKTVTNIAAYFPSWNATYTAPDVAERVNVGPVSYNFFSLLGIAPELGRAFLASDDGVGAPRTVILTHAFWMRRFNGDPSVIGKSITLDGESHAVIGIMGADFPFPEAKVDVIAPFTTLAPYWNRRGVHIVFLLGRLAPGVTIEAAQRELASIAAQLESEHPKENHGFGATVLPLRTALLGDVRTPIIVLFAAVCAVLLIGCANVANLMLARASSRRQELAVRAALGADQRAIIGQLLTESALIAVAAGAIGVGLAVVATKAMARLVPPTIARIASIHVNGTALGFTLLVSLAAALLCGLAPAFRGARSASHHSLKESARGNRTHGRRRLQSALVVAELSLSLVLVVSAGLLIISFARLAGASPGFRADHLVKMKIALADTRYRTAGARVHFFNTLLPALRQLPDVESVGGVSRFPLFDANLTSTVAPVGVDPISAHIPDFDFRIAGGDYFTTMGIPLLGGRVFTWSERNDSGATPVAVINRTGASLLFGEGNAVGERVTVSGGPPMEIVGVVGDVHDASMREAPRPQVYVSAQQSGPSALTLVIRHKGPTGPVLDGVRRTLAAIDPTTPLFAIQTVDELMSDATRGDRFTTVLLSAFSLLALLLAAVGTYGVIAFGVSERTREIGVRIALGADKAGVLAMVLREGLALMAIALPLAMLGVWFASRGIGGLLYGVSPTDPPTMIAALGTLFAATLLACYIPARRAASVDPLIAIRGAE
jgi:putative ABC transport system permease protein